MRVVLDTNVFISAILWGGIPGHIYEEVARFELITSEEQLQELKRVFSYEKFADTIARKGETPLTLLLAIRGEVRVIQPAQVSREVIRDEDDLIILGTAVGGTADYLVTGDKDFLDVQTVYQNIKSLSINGAVEKDVSASKLNKGKPIGSLLHPA